MGVVDVAVVKGGDGVTAERQRLAVHILLPAFRDDRPVRLDRLVLFLGLLQAPRQTELRGQVLGVYLRGDGVMEDRLVEVLLSRAAKAKIAEIYLLTTSAEDYFPRFGFTRTQRSVVPEGLKASAEFQGACPDTATVMSRTLGDRIAVGVRPNE